MKKVIILVGLLFTMAHTSFAEQRGVFMEFHRRVNPEKTRDVNRAPMLRLPIQVAYDSDLHTITIVGNEAIDGEVFLYNENGFLENYSSSLNVEFTNLTTGSYIINIQGDGWYAKGEIEV